MSIFSKQKDLLGKQAKDKITGFEGIITGKLTWMFGCDQYCIVPAAKDGKLNSGEWFDEGRIEVIGNGVTKEEVAAEKPGADHGNLPSVR